MKQLLGCVFFCLALSLVLCNIEHGAHSNSLFSRDFYTVLSKKSGNLLCSPLSVQMALGLLRLGARGETEAQITRALNLNHVATEEGDAGMRDLRIRLLEEDKQNDTILRLVNRMFVRQGYDLRPEFQTKAVNYYGEESEATNFEHHEAARETINAWVANITENKIQNLVQEGVLSTGTILVIVNALYFRGLWKYPFEPRKTYNGTFHITESQRVDIPFMTNEDNYRVGFLREINAKVLEIPYKSNLLSMVIIMPNNINGLAQLERSLSNKNLSEILNSLHRPSNWKIHIPRFTMEIALDLENHLEEMGMTEMFTKDADLSGIVASPKLKVSAVKQKAFLEVTEQGTEAAAATYIGLVAYSGPPTFQLNHPFLFFIVARPVGNEAIILFNGRFSSP